MNLDLSQTAVSDLIDKLSYKASTSPEAKLADCIGSPNEAFILGMYFSDWEYSIAMPHFLRIDVRHVTDSLKAAVPQFQFWTKKYLDEGNNPNEYLKYSSYILDNMFFDKKDKDLSMELAVYLGTQWGKMNGIGFDYSLSNTLVTVRCSSGPMFIGVVKRLQAHEAILLKAHEIKSSCRDFDGAMDYGTVGKLLPCVMLFDVTEIRPCIPETIVPFLQRTGITDYNQLTGIQQKDKDAKD